MKIILVGKMIYFAIYFVHIFGVFSFDCDDILVTRAVNLPTVLLLISNLYSNKIFLYFPQNEIQIHNLVDFLLIQKKSIGLIP